LHKNPREVTTSKRTLSGYHQFLSEAATTEENTTVYLALPCDIHHHKRTRGTALFSCIKKTYICFSPLSFYPNDDIGL
jgi:hypothetical protein